MDDAAPLDRFAPLPDAALVTTTAETGTPWQPIMPAPLPLPLRIRHWAHGEPTRVWRYLDEGGELLFAVCRFDTLDGGKEVLPYCCGAGGWRWMAPPAPRPLFGLDRLAARSDAPVLFTEGEKAADAAAELFPRHACLTWQGGTNATGRADWTPLAGRSVAVWPDDDAPGRKAAEAVAAAARTAGAASVAVVEVPRLWPHKWDVADAPPDGVTADRLRDMLAATEQAEPRPKTLGSPGAELAADVTRAAAMPRVDYVVARLGLAKQHGIRAADLDAMVAEVQRETRTAAAADTSPAPTPSDPRGRAPLFVNGADLPDTAAELAAMLAAVPHLFDRGGPARLARDAQRGGVVVERLTLNGVVNEAHRIARPWTWAKTRDGATEPRDVTLPERVAALYLDHREGWGLRPLDGVTGSPLLGPDGTVRVVEGYDPEARLWCERVPHVALPDTPSREEAAAALRRVRRHFRSFAFADAERAAEDGQPVPVVDVTKPAGADESAFLCALLTAVCRPCLWLAPALLVRAPSYSGSGTGKGLVVRAICAVAFGARPAAITAGGTPAELDKRLAAALMEASAALFLDNVNAATLKSDVLASAITERPAVVRPLGRSATVPLNPLAFVAVTGNGLLLSEDMARRFVTVELDAGVEDPEARGFQGDFLAETMVSRGALLRDLLTVWRWGRQVGDGLPAGRPMGSFHGWSRWCRDPLLALGCADPALRVAEAKAEDPRRQGVAAIFEAWWAAHGPAAVRVADLAEEVRAAGDPIGRGRQFLAARVRALDGTRAAGFVLTRSPSPGKWTADAYALRRTGGGAAGRSTYAVGAGPLR